MRFPIVLTALLVCPFFAAAQAPDASPTTPVETAALPAFEPTREEAVLEAFIDGVVDAHRREHDTPGVTVSVVKDGRVLFAKGYGYADAPSKTLVDGQETLFRIGSVSKTFTWTAVMMLAERGLVDLDVDVNRYLKGMQIPEAFDAPVTLNHLMAHRAGFEDSFGVYTHNDSDGKTLTELLIEDMPKRVFAPGARTSYSNWGAALAAKIVEDVSGKPFAEFMQSEIFGPLAMTKTTLQGPSNMPGGLRDHLSAGHKLEAGRAVVADYMELGDYAPAGAIASTAADMAQWMLVHLGRGEHNGVRLMTPQTHDLMLRRAFTDRAAGADVAHGFFTKKYMGYDVYGHGGGTAAFYTYMMLVPDLGLGVFVSQNAANDIGLVRQLPDLVLARLAGDAHGGAAADFTAEQARAYAGTYLSNRRSFTQFEKFFSIAFSSTVAPAEESGLVVSSPVGAVYYEPVEGAPGAFEDQYGNRIVFGHNEKGAVTHYTGSVGVHSLEKVGPFGNPVTFFAALGGALFFSATAWLGAWRRQGRPHHATPTGVKLGWFDMIAAAAIFIFVGAFAAVVAQMSFASASDFSEYPFPSVIFMRFAAYGVFGFAALAVFSLAPAWTRSGWGVWRKLHHTGFALALALLAVMLVLWEAIFSRVA